MIIRELSTHKRITTRPNIDNLSTIQRNHDGCFKHSITNINFINSRKYEMGKEFTKKVKGPQATTRLIKELRNKTLEPPINSFNLCNSPYLNGVHSSPLKTTLDNPPTIKNNTKKYEDIIKEIMSNYDFLKPNEECKPLVIIKRPLLKLRNCFIDIKPKTSRRRHNNDSTLYRFSSVSKNIPVNHRIVYKNSSKKCKSRQQFERSDRRVLATSGVKERKLLCSGKRTVYNVSTLKQRNKNRRQSAIDIKLITKKLMVLFMY